MSTYRIPPEVVHGPNSLRRLERLKGKRAAIVTGGNSMKRLGFVDDVKARLEKAGMEVIIIDGVEANPSVRTCIEGGAKMEAFGPDWIIALGGGSAMDAAKIMWVFYEHPGYDFMDLVRFKFPPLRTKAKLACIPSTSGTASEITSFAVITGDEDHFKYPLFSPSIIPDLAIVDPIIPANMTPYITATTGMDVMTHAIEAYVSTAATDVTDAMAIQAIRMVREYLPRAFRHPDDMKAREKMHNASTIAGMAFNSASLGLAHSLSHKVGGAFGMTHGEANAIFLPYVIDYNRIQTRKYDVLEGVLGIHDVADLVRDLNETVGIVSTVKDCARTPVGETEFLAVLDQLSKDAFEDGCTKTNPRKTSVEEVRKLYLASYYGKKVDF